MIYKCKNCSGNMVFKPEIQKMYCPYCDSEDSEEAIVNENTHICNMCGAEIVIGPYESAGKCPSCSQYLIFDERIKGQYQPDTIQPFVVGKDMAKVHIRNAYGEHSYMPDNFLEEVSLQKIEGIYVPFWLYDFYGNCDYDGEGTKVRTSRRGNIETIERSHYHVRRNFDVSYTRMPQDASIEMPDDVMDFMEPYDYSTLKCFDAKYMSGFLAEIYNHEASLYEPRAKQKAQTASQELLQASISGYTGNIVMKNQISIEQKNCEYALLPVWRYFYEYRGKVYPVYINGQTGKVVGETPVSKIKQFSYGMSVFLLTFLGLWMIFYIIGGVF